MAKRTLELLYAKDIGDSRVVTNEMLEQIVAADSKGARYPVAKGHLSAIGLGGDDVPAAGTVTNLRIFNGAVIGDVDLTDAVEEEYKSGAWPAWSAGIKRTFRMEDGNKIPGNWVFGHLALLGSTEAAYKDLQDLTELTFSANESNVATFSDESNDYIILAVAGTNDGAPSDVVSTDYQMGPEQTNEEEMEKQELEMMLAAANEEKEALSAKLELLMTERADAAKANFAAATSSVCTTLQNLGVSKDARENFSSTLGTMEELVANGADFSGLFAALTAVLSEVKPKVAPGDTTPKGDEESSTFSASRDATMALYGKLEG